jgi:ribA/ribD-fused uncharacterized protein
VWDFSTKGGRVEDKPIDKFVGQHRGLSNFGAPWLIHSENVFQAMKGKNWWDVLYVLGAPTPAEAKRRGRYEIECREDWEEIKLDVMYCVIQIKFAPGTENAKMLLETGDAELIEGNWWHDSFWGFDLRAEIGANHLGRLLMEWRAALREMEAENE